MSDIYCILLIVLVRPHLLYVDLVKECVDKPLRCDTSYE